MIRRHYDLFLLAIFLMLLVDGQYLILKGEGKQLIGIRESIIAGHWYPGDRNTLSSMINNYLDKVTIGSFTGEIIAGIVPHAGYEYSGQVAACAYEFLKGKDFKRVIIIGPSHRVGFNAVSVNLQTGYKTPLGITPVDRIFGQRLIQSSNLIRFIPRAHEMEHSIEIQLPFLQTVLKDFSIVPVVMGSTNDKIIDALSKAIISAVRNDEETLILASSDLSHYHHDERARELDKEFIRHVEKFDPQGLSEALSSGSCEACGRAPVIATMIVAKELKADHASILCYANSGDVTGDKRRVVGYLSALFLKKN